MQKKSRKPRSRNGQPKPFFRDFNQTWYLQLGKKQINLGRDEKAAFDQYHKIMTDRDVMTSVTLPASKFFEAYLQWLSEKKALATYAHARHYLTSFVRFVGKRRQIRDITGENISKWVETQHLHRKREEGKKKPKKWSSTTQSDAVSHLRRAYHWGRQYVKHSPVDDLDLKLKRRRREVVYSPADWERILAEAKDECFRDILTFMWETGCRPQEARQVEARHVDVANEIVVFQASESKTGQVRVILLSDTAVEVCQRLCRAHPDGPIFRNSRETAWTKDSIKNRFRRMKSKVGIEGLCAYGIRHSFATESLKSGIDSTSLAVMMGHVDVSMVARQYQHLAEDLEYLKSQLKRVRSGDAKRVKSSNV